MQMWNMPHKIDEIDDGQTNLDFVISIWTF